MAAGLNRPLFVAGMLLLGGLAGCTCDRVKTNEVCPTELVGCDSNNDCPERFVCRTSKGHPNVTCCDRAVRTCSTESECCPGQVCTSEGRCADKFDECVNDSDCGDADRVCQKWVDPTLGESMRCTYAKCGAQGECPDGQSCFDSFCVIAPPCGGTCPDGTGCVPQDNRCHPYGTLCPNFPAKPGYMVVFTKPDNVYDTCSIADLACQYVELPPLQSNDLGRHASVAVADNQLHVAMYDGQYGDLVVADYDAAGTLLKRTWVDGVPSGKTPTAGPSGPRGGVVDPGDDVGKFTSIAAGNSTLYVSYYDQTNGDLRYVERNADGTWSTPQVVDSAGDVGLFTSLKLDPSGNPVIAYFQKGGGNTSGNACPDSPLATGLKVATAKKQHPASTSDWTVEMVSCGLRAPPPCYGCTAPGSGQICVSGDTGSVCASPALDCNPACGTGETCVAGTGGAPSACLKQGVPVELAGIPLGQGLFPSLSYNGAMPVVAWYDHNHGDLYLSQKEAGTTWKSYLVDDAGDVGLYPSLAFDSGNYTVAYHDATKRRLKLYSANTPTPNAQAFSVIDDGLADPMKDGPSWVGADASLLFATSGTYVAYQNATGGDLRLVKKGSAGWSMVQEYKEGALGFFAHAVEMGGKIYVVHTRIHTKPTPGKPVPDHQLKIEIVTPQ